VARRTFIQPVPEYHAHALGFRVWRVRGPIRMPVAHTHPDVEVNFLLSGKFTYVHGGGIATVEPLRFTVFWGGIPHWICSRDKGQRGIWMTLPLAWLLEWQLPRNLPARLFAGEVLSGRPDETDAALLERWLRDFDSGSAGRRRAMLLEMQARFQRLALSKSAKPVQSTGKKISPQTGLTQMERITDYMARHYREPLTVDEIAAELGLHGKYLMRLFKRHSGMSVAEYIARMRISHAQRLLLTTDMKIIDIALEAGFASIGPFYRAFAAYCPSVKRPLDYRRRVDLTSA
jgi:AraC-like DNA-binding protein